MTYQAFLSYSHSADDKLSPAVQSALHRFAKPWYRRRAMRVFRDQTSLAADPSLWTAIQRALESSEYLLLMASPHAARSVWVNREVEWWLSNRSADKLLVLLTEGDLVWDPPARDWDWQRTTALPPALGGRGGDEPLYVDLRWARDEALSLGHTRFRAAILDIAATIRGIPKDELDGEDVRQSRRTRRIAGAAVAAIALFGVVAAWQAVIATQQRTRAEDQARIARSREVAVSSIAARERDPELALLLGIEAGQVAATPEAEDALRRALAGSQLRGILSGVDATAEHVSFSPDGRSLAVENWDGTVRVWDVAARRIRYEVNAAVSFSGAIAFSPDGQSLVTDGAGMRVTVFDASTGKERYRVANAGDARVSSDSRLLLVTSVRDAYVHDLASGQRLATVTDKAMLRDARFYPDGQRLVTLTGDQPARVWRSDSGEPAGILGEADERVSSVRFDRTGKIALLASNAGLRLLEPDSGKLIRTIPSLQNPLGADFASNAPGKILISESGGRTRVWDAVLEKSLLEVPGEQALLVPNGDYVASTRGVWDLESGDQIASFYGPPTTPARGLAVAPDGRSVAIAYDDGSTRIWSAGIPDGTPLRFAVEHGVRGMFTISAIAFNPAETRVAAVSRDGWLAVWPRERTRPLWEKRAHDGEGTSVAFSPDGKLIVTAGKDGLGRVWEAETGRSVAALQGQGSWMNRASFSPDGTLILSEAYDRTARLWDPATGQSRAVLGGHTDGVYCAGFDASGEYVVTCDAAVHLWKARTGAAVRVIQGRRPEGAADASFSPSGKYLLTADGTVRIWEVSTGALVAEIEDTANGVFGATDDRLLTLSGDGAHILDWRRRLILTVVPFTAEAAWSPNGRFAVSTIKNDPLSPPMLWETATGSVLMRLRGAVIQAAPTTFSRTGKFVAIGGGDMHSPTENPSDLVNVFECDVCGSLDELSALARVRVTRTLTPAERATYLHE
ncbi:MAG: TIR domain-containing protein [Acidobacteriota bacterium]